MIVKMKKRLLFLVFVALFVLLPMTKVQATNKVTYLYGEAVKIKDEGGNIEVLSDEMIIDTRTSKIIHTILLQNNEDYEIATEIAIPLENKELSTKVKNLNILVNDFLVEATNNNGDYIVKTKIPAKQGKKLEIKYETENDLKDARIIKYNLDNLKGKVIGKEKVDFIFDEVEIPLITGIYPGHYTFENNTISVEYYNLNINTITKDFIIEKETYSNLLYGRENSLSEQEIRVANNAKTWIENNIEIDYDSIRTDNGMINQYGIQDIARNILKIENYPNEWTGKYLIEFTKNTAIDNIVNYAICKQIIKDQKFKISSVILSYQGGNSSQEVVINSRLIYDMLYQNNAIAKYDTFNNDQYDLFGKTVCIDFVETEQNKALYRAKVDYWGDENGNYKEDEYFPIKERDVLKANFTWADSFYGAKVIYVGEGIDGNNLNATEEEKIEYINSIGADLYIRDELYSGEKEKDQIGYYNNEDEEMAIAFSGVNIEYWNSENSSLRTEYSNFEEYKNSFLTKLNNDYISENCKVPTLVLFVGQIKQINNRYVVNTSKGMPILSGVSGLRKSINIIKTDRAQQLISSNKENNSNTKKIVEHKILNVTLVNNEKEIQEEIRKVDESKSTVQIKESQIKTKDIAVLSTIALLIFICFIVLIINRKRRK